MYVLLKTDHKVAFVGKIVWIPCHKPQTTCLYQPARSTPSPSSCTWSLLSTFLCRDISFMRSLVSLYFCGLVMSIVMLVCQCCRHLSSASSQLINYRFLVERWLWLVLCSERQFPGRSRSLRAQASITVLLTTSSTTQRRHTIRPCRLSRRVQRTPRSHRLLRTLRYRPRPSSSHSNEQEAKLSLG